MCNVVESIRQRRVSHVVLVMFVPVGLKELS
jgi:hypothetical protein